MGRYGLLPPTKSRSRGHCAASLPEFKPGRPLLYMQAAVAQLPQFTAENFFARPEEGDGVRLSGILLAKVGVVKTKSAARSW